MIDKTIPEAIRFRSEDFSVTHELRCPVCGGKVSYRSWDAEHNAFCYHCTYCGHDTKITWEAAAVLRAKGEVKFDKNGAPIVPDDVEVPPLPADPDNAAYEDWAIMQEAEAPAEEETQTVNRTITITGTGCNINNATATAKAETVQDGGSYEFTVESTTQDVSIVSNNAVDFDHLGVTVDGNAVSDANKRGLTWVIVTDKVKFTMANVKADHTIVVSVVE